MSEHLNKRLMRRIDADMTETERINRIWRSFRRQENARARWEDRQTKQEAKTETSTPEPTRTSVSVLDMPLERWDYASCSAHFAVGADWATLYDIHSVHEGQGHATTLLLAAKRTYEAEGKVVGGSVALNDRMARLYAKVGIPEYGEED